MFFKQSFSDVTVKGKILLTKRFWNVSQKFL